MRKRSQQGYNDEQKRNLEAVIAEFNYEGQIADLEKQIAEEKASYRQAANKKLKGHQNYSDNGFNNKLSTVEHARTKVKLDKLQIKQALREKSRSDSINMTSRIYGSMSRFNPDFENPLKQTIPYGSNKGRIGDMHERLKAIDANKFDSMGGSPRSKAMWRDHMPLVGHSKGTGRFESGKSVPKTRPTLFWEQQPLDLRFDYEEY